MKDANGRKWVALTNYCYEKEDLRFAARQLDKYNAEWMWGRNKQGGWTVLIPEEVRLSLQKEAKEKSKASYEKKICLSCKKPFRSWGSQNRLCAYCAELNKGKGRFSSGVLIGK